jgi:hypothetical protein
MLDNYGIAEPEKKPPSIWRETDDPAMIAMCARLLANKTLVPETYPPPEKMREALEAAQKLYAQPEIPITEWLVLFKSRPVAG